MSNLDMVIVRDAPEGFTLPQGFEEYFDNMGDNFFFRTKFNFDDKEPISNSGDEEPIS
jgi:hypothetical protein